MNYCVKKVELNKKLVKENPAQMDLNLKDILYHHLHNKNV